MKWQKRARFGVAVFGIVSAGVVYSAIGERQTAAPRPAVQRLDPKALLESTAGLLRQVRGTKEDYEVHFDQQLTYENGRTRLMGVRIVVKQRDGRDFEVKAQQADAGENQRALQLTGNVALQASDGFELHTSSASFNQDTGIVDSSEEVTFNRGGMRGSGTGMTYDRNSDVLTIRQRAHVEMKDDAGMTTMDFVSGTGTLDRTTDLLTLDQAVRVNRGEEVIEADHGVAHLDSEDRFITLVELRGNARVQGTSSSLDAMSARDIDLHYSPDGKLLQSVTLNGGSAIALKGQNGGGGRSITGDSIVLEVAADGSVTSAVVRDPKAMRLVLPAAEGTPGRSIQARALDATGQEGKGLTDARFTDDVEFREEAQKSGGAPRIVRSRALQAALTDDSVGAALFTGNVTFEEQGFRAAAAQANYDPDGGTLRLNGSDQGGRPCVADDQIAVDAQSIDVVIDSRKMSAKGTVKTSLHPTGRICGFQAGTPTAAKTSKLPGLLQEDRPANVNAGSLEYEGAAGTAVYSGDAALWQGETSIRGNVITLDQQNGDVTASGAASSTIAYDTGSSIGRAHEIRYQDARRTISYTPPPPPVPVTGRATAAAAAAPVVPPTQPQLIGPQGELRADRIEVILASEGSTIDRVEAYDHVTMTVDPGTPNKRTASGGRLTYRAATEQYDIQGTAAALASVVEACRSLTGQTVTFFKSTNRITVDGRDQVRTQTKSGGPCPQPATPAPPRP